MLQFETCRGQSEWVNYYNLRLSYSCMLLQVSLLVAKLHVSPFHPCHLIILQLQEVCAGPLDRDPKVFCTSALFPISLVCFSTLAKSLLALCSQTFFIQPTAGIPSLDLILEATRADKKCCQETNGFRGDKQYSSHCVL